MSRQFSRYSSRVQLLVTKQAITIHVSSPLREYLDQVLDHIVRRILNDLSRHYRPKSGRLAGFAKMDDYGRFLGHITFIYPSPGIHHEGSLDSHVETGLRVLPL